AGNQVAITAFRTPRIDDRSVIRSLVRRAHGELIHVELAEHDGTVVPQIGRYGRFIARLEAIENMARSLGVDALGREEILHADWNAFERARAIMRQTLIRGFRHLA